VNELSALRTKRLMVNFETDEAQQDREIDMKTREITDLFHHAEGLLRVFDKQRQDKQISKSEATVITNMQRSQAKKLQGLNMSFKSAQKVSTSYFYLAVTLKLNVSLFALLLGVLEPTSNSDVGRWCPDNLQCSRRRLEQ
jgi:hypothetical protein